NASIDPSVEMKTLSNHVATRVARAPWFVTVKSTVTKPPELAAAGTVSALTSRSASRNVTRTGFDTPALFPLAGPSHTRLRNASGQFGYSAGARPFGSVNT